MRRRYFILTILFVLLSISAWPQEYQTDIALRIGRPVAISGMSNSSYYVLTSDSVVFRYLGGRQLSFHKRFDVGPPAQPTDVAFFRSGTEESVLVALWFQSLAMGQIYMFSPDGKMLHSWRTTKIPSGLAIDESKQILYFSSYFGSAESNELYRINLRGGQPEFVCSLSGVERAGALAVDSANQVVYVADASGGKVMKVDMSQRRATITTLVRDLQLPSALLLDAGNRVLYVSDAMKKTVLAVKLAAQGQSPMVITRSPKLRSPSGLAFGPDGSILVADSKADAVFVLRK